MWQFLRVILFAATILATHASGALACHALPEVGTVAKPADATTPHITPNTLHLCHAWVRLAPPAVPITAAYLHVHNNSAQDDVLISVSAPIAERVELHETTQIDGIAKMRALPNGVPLPKGAHVEMKPGGIHIMLMALKSPLSEGQKLPITLNFTKRAPLTVEAVVQKAMPSAVLHQH